MRKSRIHFEQIPLDLVKKIAEADVLKDGKAGADTVIVEPAAKKGGPGRAPARSIGRKGR